MKKLALFGVAMLLAFVAAQALAAPLIPASQSESPPTTAPAPAPPPCIPAKKVYALKRWRIEHPARGKSVCAEGRRRLKHRFFAYADRRFRACEPRDCVRWAGRKVDDSTQMRCLYALWTRESGWSRYADNPSSDAHGIPQANPGAKMGPGWVDDGKVQIDWGLDYIGDRYGTPCAADGYQAAHNYY